jgi:hypothetical protein
MMSETSGTERLGTRDARDVEREDPSIAGKPEVAAFGDEAETGDSTSPAGRLEEREERQQAVQQHGERFAVDSDEPTDTSGIERGSARNRTTTPLGDEPLGEKASGEGDTG